MSRPKAWIAWSSGKDSAWALHLVWQAGEVEVAGLLTTITEPYSRVSMHGVRVELLEAQARSLGLPLHQIMIPDPCPNEVYESALRDMLENAKAGGVTCIVHGDINLVDVRKYREEKLAGIGMSALFPLWGCDTGELAREMIAAGLRAYITCLDARKVPRELAGREFDQELLAALPEHVDPLGESGEFHTFATEGPMFSRPIKVRVGETVEREGFVFTDLMPAESGG